MISYSYNPPILKQAVKYFPRHYHVLPPVKEGVQRKVHWEYESSDKDDEPEESVMEGEEGGENVVDTVDGGVVRVLLNRVQKDPLFNSNVLILSIFWINKYFIKIVSNTGPLKPLFRLGEG